jgi:CBS domain-containing protein
MIHKDASIAQAIEKITHGRVRETGDKTKSLMVIDEYNHLAGVITMFDILYHLRPSFLNYGINGDELAWNDPQITKLVDDLKDKKVGQLMSDNVTGASPDDHIIVILDRMIKNNYHRLPVLENNFPIGVVYVADIYYSLFGQNR